MKVSELHTEYVARPDPALMDHVVVLQNASWADFEMLERAGGNKSQPRLKYLEGRVELMTTSKPHETIKMRLGQMLDLWALREGIELNGFGQYTLKSEASERAAEAD